MKLIIRFIAIITLMGQVTAYSQNLDSIKIEEAEKVIRDNFNNRLDGKTYLLYNIEDKYIVVEKRADEGKLYYISNKAGIEDSINVCKKSKILRNAFNTEMCSTSLTNIKSDSIYNHYNPHSSFLYYYIKQGGTKYCEFYLPVMYNIDIKKKEILPIDKKTHGFLMDKMITYWKDDF